MKYASIDIETTGIDPESNQILSIGIILEDSNNPLPYEELPKFHCAIKRTEISGSLFAIDMNKDLIATINSYMTAIGQDEKNDMVHFTGMQFLNEHEVVMHIAQFMQDNSFINGTVDKVPYQIICAGKNFGTFDKLFLQKLSCWNNVFRISQRVLDPGLLYIDWKNDKTVPNMITCKERGNVPGVVTHNALEDAWDVVQLLRNKY
jgi:hypothetical protein